MNGLTLFFLFNVALNITALWILYVDNHVDLRSVCYLIYWHDAAKLFFISQMINDQWMK